MKAPSLPSSAFPYINLARRTGPTQKRRQPDPVQAWVASKRAGRGAPREEPADRGDVRTRCCPAWCRTSSSRPATATARSWPPRGDINDAMATARPGYPRQGADAHVDYSRAAPNRRSAAAKRPASSPVGRWSCDRRETALARPASKKTFSSRSPASRNDSEAAPIIDLVDLVVKKRDQEQGERRPRRADGQGRAHPSPSRRPAQRSDGPARRVHEGLIAPAQDRRGRGWTSPRSGCRRTAVCARRPTTAPRTTSACRRCARWRSARKVGTCVLDHRKGRDTCQQLEEIGMSGGGARGSARVLPPPSAR